MSRPKCHKIQIVGLLLVAGLRRPSEHTTCDATRSDAPENVGSKAKGHRSRNANHSLGCVATAIQLRGRRTMCGDLILLLSNAASLATHFSPPSRRSNG